MFTAKLFWNPCILSPKIPIFHELFRRLWMPFWLCNVSYITDKKYSKVSTSKRIFFYLFFHLKEWYRERRRDRVKSSILVTMARAELAWIWEPRAAFVPPKQVQEPKHSDQPLLVFRPYVKSWIRTGIVRIQTGTHMGYRRHW